MLLPPAVRSEHEPGCEPPDAAHHIAEGGAHDSGDRGPQSRHHRERRRARDPCRRVAGGHVADLVSEDAGQLVLRVHDRQEPARHVDVAPGQSEGIRLFHVDDVEHVRVVSGRVLDEPLPDGAQVGIERRGVVEAHRLGDALRLRVAELLLLGAGYQDDLRPLLDRIPGAPRREQAADEGGSEPDRDRHRAWTSVLEESQTVGTVPPSITYSLPWIEAARLDARKATSSATSSGRPGLPIGIPPSESIRLSRAVSVSVPALSARRAMKIAIASCNATSRH